MGFKYNWDFHEILIVVIGKIQYNDKIIKWRKKGEDVRCNYCWGGR